MSEEVDDESADSQRSVNRDEVEIRDSFVFRESDADFRESDLGPERDSELEFRMTEVLAQEAEQFIVKEKPKPTFCQLLAITSIVTGVSFTWCIFLISSRVFISDMGIDHNIVEWWFFVLPPLVNMTTQVLVGWISDCCFVNSCFFGRRKIYLPVGILMAISSFFTCCHSDWMGIFVFSFFPGFEIFCSLVSFLVVMISLSSCFLLVRVLISDITPQSLLVFSNSCFNFFYSLGYFVAIIISLVPFPILIPFYSYSIKMYFYISLVFILFPFLCCFYCITEYPYTEPEVVETSRISFEEVDPLIRHPQDEGGERGHNFHSIDQIEEDNDSCYSEDEGEIEFPPKEKNPFLKPFLESTIMHRATSLNYTYYLSIVIQFFTFFARTTILYFVVDFFKLQILEDNLDGYIWGYISLVAYFLCSSMASPLIIGISIIVPNRYIWFMACCVQVVGMISLPFIYNTYVGCAVFFVLGIVECAINTIPWSIMMETFVVCSLEKKGQEFKKKGFFIGLFNLSQCLATILVVSFGYSLHILFVQVFELPFGIPMAFSAFPSIIAAVLICFLKEPQQKRWITCSELLYWFVVTPFQKLFSRVSYKSPEDIEFYE